MNESSTPPDPIAERSQRKRGIPLALVHPILFAAWPVLALYGQNADKLFPALLIYPLAVFIGFALVLTGLFRIIARDWAKAAMMASVAVIALCGIWKPIGQDRLLLWSALNPLGFDALYAFLLVVALALIWASKADLRRFTPAVNVAACALVAWPLIQIASTQTETKRIDPTLRSTEEPLMGGMADATEKPNVVLIIVDEYSRADLLLERYGFDNSEFIHALEARGFYVAENSTSNYDSTTASVPSMLNMDYIKNLGVTREEFHILREVMRRNRVMRLFNAMGYTTYAFATGFGPTEPGPEVDHVLPSRAAWSSVNEFQGTLIQFTPVSEVFRLLGRDWRNDQWRDHVLYILRNVHKPLEMTRDTPVYVRAHVISPHMPFVLNADGGPHHPDIPFSLGDILGQTVKDFEVQLINQTRGLNKHILDAVDKILAASEEPPIIIITGDHGTKTNSAIGRSRSILLALHLPGRGADVPKETLDSIHLVNLFRVLFNTYFDAGLPYLEALEGEEHREQLAEPHGLKDGG